MVLFFDGMLQIVIKNTTAYFKTLVFSVVVNFGNAYVKGVEKA
jgi:hypothetical protein